jgi:hypothetical protein
MNGAVKVFNALTIIFGIILIFWFTQLNYGDLSFKTNSNAYLGISSVAMMIFAIQMIKRSIKKAGEKKKE